MIKKYHEFIVERFSLKDDFGITYDDLREILYYITDEFPQLEFQIEDSLQSSLIEKDDNCFIISFNHTAIDFPIDLPVLYFIEPKIFNLIEDVDAQLRPYGLYIYTSDFGQSDAYYELVVCKLGHTPKDTRTPLSL